MAASLKSLPFPIDELTWEKLPLVAKHLKVSKAEALTIMHHVLGAPPTPLPAACLCSVLVKWRIQLGFTLDIYISIY
jgi:hypothetical protein